MKKLEGQELYRKIARSTECKKAIGSSKAKQWGTAYHSKKQEELIRKQEERILLQEAIIQNQALRIEYLEKIVFGKSKGKKRYDGDTGEGIRRVDHLSKSKKRKSESYQRAIPKRRRDYKY